MTGLAQAQLPSRLDAGTVVSVGVGVPRVGAPARRYGVVTDRDDEYGLPLVITLTKGLDRVMEECWLGFTGASPADVHGATTVPAVALHEAARARLYQTCDRASVGDKGLFSVLGMEEAVGGVERVAESGFLAGSPIVSFRNVAAPPAR